MSLDEVGRVTSTSKSQMYHYFASKDELVAAVVTCVRDRIVAFRTVLFQLTEPPLQRATALSSRSTQIHDSPVSPSCRGDTDVCSMARWLHLGFPRLILAAPRNPLSSPPGLRCRKELDDMKCPEPHILVEP